MNYQSKKGFATKSPFNRNPTNTIDSGQIDMRGTGRELLAFNQSGGRTLQPGQQYDLGTGPTTEMPVETLFQMEPMLVELHLGTLTKAKQKEFVEKYQPLPDNMKKAALMQMFQMHGKDLQPEIMQQGGFTNPMLNQYGMDSSTTQVAQRPLQQLDYGRAFSQFAQPAMNEVQNLRQTGNLDASSQLVDDILLRNQVMMRDRGNVMRPYQAGGEVPQYNRILPPTEGYRLVDITSNRPNPANTTDVVKNPQGMRPVKSSKGRTKSDQTASTKSQPPQTIPVEQYAPLEEIEPTNYSAISVRFEVIGTSPDGKTTDVYDPVTGGKLTRNNETGLYTPTGQDARKVPRFKPKQITTTQAVAQVTGVPPVAYAPQTAYGQVPQQMGTARESSRMDTVPMADMRIGEGGRDYSANSDRFVFISSTPDGQFTNVYDPVSGAKLTRNNKTGLYSPTR